MSAKLYPNTFQTFNVYVDRAMEHLTDSELRVLLYATRHIMGWQEKTATRIGCLSLTMLERGFIAEHEDGTTTVFGGCGLSRPVISKALGSLEAFGFLERKGYIQGKGQLWQLADDPKWEALEARTTERLKVNQKRTTKATQSRSIVTSDVNTSIVTSDVHTIVTSHDTMIVTSDVPKQTHVQTHIQSGEDRVDKIPEAPAEKQTPSKVAGYIGNDRPAYQDTIANMQGYALIQAYIAAHPDNAKPVGAEYNNTTKRIAATLAQAGYTPNEVTELVQRKFKVEGKTEYPFIWLPADLAKQRTQKAKTERERAMQPPIYVAKEPTPAAVSVEEAKRLIQEAKKQIRQTTRELNNKGKTA